MGKSSTSRFWLYASGGAFLVSLTVAALFIASAERISFIPNFAYYILLIPLGAAAAAFLFGAMRSFAHYSGKVVYGTLELGGPVVVFALVVLGGYFFAGSETTFDLTVRVHGPEGPAQVITEGTVLADFGENRRTEAIGSNGQATFFEVPVEYRSTPIQVIPHVDGYRAAETGPFRIPPEGVIALRLERVPDSTRVRGTVFDPDGRTVAGARLSFAHGVADTTTGSDGQFAVTLPYAEGERAALMVTIDGSIVYDNFVVVSEADGYAIRIEEVPE